MAKRQLSTNDDYAGKSQRLDVQPDEMEVDEPYHIEESNDKMPRKYGYEERKFKVKLNYS